MQELPSSRDAAHRAAASRSRPRAARPLLLLAGDRALRPADLERDLLRAGYQVAEVDDPDQLPGRPDVVLVCCRPLEAGCATQVDGYRSARDAGAQLILLLADGRPDDLVAAAEAGADDAVLLPAEGDQLLARIRARIVSPRTSVHGPGGSDLRLFEALQQVAVELHRDEMLHALVRTLAHATNVASVSCLLHGGGSGTGRLVAATDAPKLRDVDAELDAWPEAVAALDKGHTIFIPDASASTVFARTPDGATLPIQTSAAIPLVLLGRPIGSVVLRTLRGETGLTRPQLAFAELVVAAASRLLDTDERRGAIARRQSLASNVDPLTGCGTLDALDRRIREEFERARRYDVSFGLVLFDVDGMRLINERLGRDGGHRVLAELGRLLQRELRAPDFVARYGGEEFLLLLPETDLDGARNAVHRIRARLDASGLDEHHMGVRCTLTAGIAAYPHPGVHKPEDMFALVERAMLAGKAEPGERIGSAA